MAHFHRERGLSGAAHSPERRESDFPSLGAQLIRRLARARTDIVVARRIVAILGFVGASASVFAFSQVADPVRAMLLLGLAGFFNDFVMPAAWAGTMDVGGRYSGTVSGAMNMMGSVAGASSTRGPGRSGCSRARAGPA